MTDTRQKEMRTANILCVVGARPNFMKIAPIITALQSFPSILSVTLLHTGQHYDVAMNTQYFEALGIPAPDINLDVGSGSHANQTAEIMRRFEPVLDELNPAAVLVVGDVNSTIACALVAAKKQVPVIHVEAGLRSGDRSMPEEVNRVLTDQISDLLFTTEEGARANLLREGIDERRIHFAGNVMIDTLRSNLDRAITFAQTARAMGRPDFGSDGYGLLTLHRPSNVDDPKTLEMLLSTVKQIAQALPLFFPVHPRTRSMAERHGLSDMLQHSQLLLLPPVGYLEMLGLMKDARVVLSDSGGIQEETTALGVPCLTLRDNTERPITVEEGTNIVVGTDPKAIIDAFTDALQTGGKSGRIPKFWDGEASARIATVIAEWVTTRKAT